MALLVAIGALPLLLAIWLLAFGRAWVEARRRQDARLRLALAGELGLRPRELKSLTPKALLKLREQVTFDELTGTLRRAPGVAAVEREVARARRLKESLSVAFIDVDNLKRANDSHGHAAGDRLLKGVANLLQEQLRGQDLIFRFGGDEFVCLLPETGIIVAQETLVRLQDEASERQVPFSFGVAELEPGDDTVSLLGRADSRLYEAKQGHSWARPAPVRLVRPTVVARQGPLGT